MNACFIPTRLDAPLPYPRRDWTLLRDRAITLKLRLPYTDPRYHTVDALIFVLNSTEQLATRFPQMSAQLWGRAGELACKLAGQWNG